MNKNYIKHLLILSLGAFILGIGCVFFVQSMLGADAMTTFSQGLSVVLPFTLSQCYIGLNFTMFVIAVIIDRHQVGLGTLVFPIISGQVINIFIQWIPELYGFYAIIGFIIGLVLIALGVAIAAKVSCGKSPNDAMNFALMNLFKQKYNVIRGIVDALMLIVGIALGGTWGLGTVIAVLCVGTIAMLFMNLIDRFIVNKVY